MKIVTADNNIGKNNNIKYYLRKSVLHWVSFTGQKTKIQRKAMAQGHRSSHGCQRESHLVSCSSPQVLLPWRCYNSNTNIPAPNQFLWNFPLKPTTSTIHFYYCLVFFSLSLSLGCFPTSNKNILRGRIPCVTPLSHKPLPNGQERVLILMMFLSWRASETMDNKRRHRF